MTTTINADDGVVSGSAGLKYSADATGVLALQTAGTTAVSISASQVVTFTNPPTGVFPSGTTMLFYQASAPTGWTQVTTAGLNDSALRIVTGTGGATGGSVAFTTAFASQTPAGTVSVGVSAGTLAVSAGTLATANFTAGGTNSGGSVSSYTLATADIPSHTHSSPSINVGLGCGSATIVSNAACSSGTALVSNATGGGGGHSHGFTQPTFTGTAHNHTITGSPSLSGSPSITSATFTGTAINLAVKYVDIILCSKN